MMLEWREREHEEDDAIVGNDLGIVAALRECGLLKIFRILGMRAQLRLLEYLVHMSNVDQHVFHVGVHTLTLDIEDIYFLTGLSRLGYHATLTEGRGRGLPMSEHVRKYCVPKVERSKGKVAIWGVQNLALRNILFTIVCMVRSVALHMALQSYFQYAIECTEPRVFNWSDAVPPIRDGRDPLEGGRGSVEIKPGTRWCPKGVEILGVPYGICVGMGIVKI
jgi:hypothetical protein